MTNIKILIQSIDFTQTKEMLPTSLFSFKLNI